MTMLSVVTSLLSFGVALSLCPSRIVPFQSTKASFVPRRTGLSMATWSDSRAVKEYQDFLASGKSEIEKTPDGPSVIIKPAEGSTVLADALVAMGMGDDVVLTPGNELPTSLGGSETYPIYITVPPTQLKEFLKSLPESYKDRRDDFVFFSGGLTYGNIEGMLKDFGYCRDAMTQVLITGVKFSPRIEDLSVRLGYDAQGEEKWAGECAACGKWNGAIEQRLEQSAVKCKTGFYREWRRLMWERNAYDAVFHLVGAVRSEPTTVNDVALYYDKEVSEILWGISGYLRGSRAVTLTYGFEERLFGVAEETGVGQPCMLVDDMYPFLYEPFEMVGKFMEYMCYGQDECGLLSTVKFIRRNVSMEKPPVIRSGNLRADGVV